MGNVVIVTDASYNDITWASAGAVSILTEGGAKKNLEFLFISQNCIEAEVATLGRAVDSLKEEDYATCRSIEIYSDCIALTESWKKGLPLKHMAATSVPLSSTKKEMFRIFHKLDEMDVSFTVEHVKQLSEKSFIKTAYYDCDWRAKKLLRIGLKKWSKI